MTYQTMKLFCDTLSNISDTWVVIAGIAMLVWTLISATNLLNRRK